MSKKQRNKAKRKPKRPPAPPRFAIGDQVRVKAGITDSSYPDLPIGGWAGTITEVEEGFRAATYLIEWNQRTLDAMHPVFLKRCQRDDLERESMWLGENDIEPDTGESIPIEQPTQLVTRPLNPRDQDDRIRAILDLTSDDPLPAATEETLGKYHRYLAKKLTFPFQAKLEEEIGPLQTRASTVTVTRLLDAIEEDEGLLCKALRDGEDLEPALADLVHASGPNRQLVEDYGYWFHNWQGGSDSAIQSQQVSLPAFLLPTVVVTGMAGALYGATLGATWTAVEGGAVAVTVAAIVVGLLVGLFGTGFGPVFGPGNGRWRGSWLGGTLGTVVGVIVGGLLGALLIAFVGALVGALAGGLVGKLVRLKFAQPLLWFVVAGAMIGVVVQAWRTDADAAWSGAWVGAVTGVILGPALFLGGGLFLARRMTNRT